MDLIKRYNKGIEWLDWNYSYFLTHVLKIGRPMPTHSIPTAAVAAKIGKETDFEFLFNEEFAAKLDTPSMAFILAHETMHIILNHLKLQRNFVDVNAFRVAQDKGMRNMTKEERKGAMKAKRDAMLFNIAADCVINDYLYEGGMYENSGVPLCRGQEWIGENAAFLTVTDVYERIKKQTEDQQQDQDSEGENGEGGSGFVMADGSMGEYSEFDSHNWMLSDEEIDKLADAIDKLIDKIDEQTGLPQDLIDKAIEEQGKNTAGQQSLQDSMQAGNQDAAMDMFARDHGVNMAWVRLLNDLDPDMFKQPGIAPPMIPSFHNRRRKLMANDFKKVHLPVYRKEERREDKAKEIPSIVLALDVSGSIGAGDANRFVSLAMTIPRDRVKVFPCVFQENYQKIDLDDPKFRQGGGTNFNAIANFINNEVKPELKGKSPKAVVVITDGQADMAPNLWPAPEERDGWLWLISPADRSRGARVIANVGTKKMLKEYIV